MSVLTEIICPVDFEEHSLNAVRFSAALAARDKLPLTLIHVVTPIPTYATESEASVLLAPEVHSSLAARIEEAKNLLEGLKISHERDGALIKTEVIEGHPGNILVERALENPRALMVLGTRGHRGIRRFILGSTTAELLRRAVCPILTLREGQETSEIKLIGVGVDFSGECTPAVEIAASMARHHQAALHLVHVLQAPEIPVGIETNLPVYSPDLRADLFEVAKKELNAIAETLGNDLSITVKVLDGPTPWRDLARYCRDEPVDLLCLGTHGRTGLDRLFLGSVTQRLIQIAPCPVLAAKPHRDVPDQLSWEEVEKILDKKESDRSASNPSG